MIRPVPAIAGMAPYALADLGVAGVLSLAQNESAFPPSPEAVAAGHRALSQAPLYPDPDWRDLRAAIGAVHGVAADRILCGAGSMELIGALVRAFAGPGDTVLGSAHGYLFVATACQQAGASYHTVDETALRVAPAALLAALTPQTRIVFVCNPGNPTGTRIDTAAVVGLRDRLPASVLLIVDQAYAEFDAQDARRVFDLVDRGDTVVVRTLSKAYGLAGARVGWGLFPDAIAAEVRKLLNPNNVSTVSQAMATAAIHDQAHMRRVVAQTAAIRDRAAGRLRKAGYAVPESHTNFLLIPFASADAAAAADARLRAAGLLLRGMGGYGLGHCLRATVVAAEPMDRMTDILVSLKERPA